MNLPCNPSVLLLDDDPFMLKLLQRHLVHFGLTSVVAHASGRSALAALDAMPVERDLIMLDLNMPEMDGIEFVRHLVERNFRGGLILISGEDARMLQAATLLVHAHKINLLGHLQKPVDPQALKSLLSGWHAGNTQGLRAERKQYDAQALRTAIQDNQLVNYYQPKVSVATGELMGVETLVRWKHPSDGMVFPDQFIDTAESHGLIDALTHAVLTQAFVDTAVWNSQGLQLKVAVNVSMDNLAKVEFADFVANQAQAAGIAPQMTVLEVTESRLMTDMRAPLEILTRLRLRRFRLSIDDFGTGHSSLAQLRNAPFEELKIDRSFVHGAHADETNRAIFFASLGLAKELGMEVVAEGVEDQADWDFLVQSGCDLAQGYFIGRPMPAVDIQGWHRIWQKRRDVGLPFPHRDAP